MTPAAKYFLLSLRGQSPWSLNLMELYSSFMSMLVLSELLFLLCSLLKLEQELNNESKDRYMFPSNSLHGSCHFTRLEVLHSLATIPTEFMYRRRVKTWKEQVSSTHRHDRKSFQRSLAPPALWQCPGPKSCLKPPSFVPTSQKSNLSVFPYPGS